MDLMQYFPYDEPRDIQREVLEILGANWHEFDVFVIRAPTAFGKTGLARTLQNAFRSVSVITPTNLLVEQYLDEFPDTQTLARLDSYYCEKWDRPCPITRAKLQQFCSRKRDDVPCPASGDLSVAKYQRGPGVYNYHTYAAHRLYRDVLVIDEAHNVLQFLRDRQAQRIWQHDYRYPSNMWSYPVMQDWLDKLPPAKRKNKKIALLQEAIRFQVPTHIANRTTAQYNGKGTVRGEPEDRDCVELLPVDISSAPPILWPRDVKKLVLMSATIGPKDIEQLGLGNRRIQYLDCESPIPPGNRPIVPLDTAAVNRNTLANGVEQRLAQEIMDIAEHHTGEKGVVHATYQLANALRPYLPSDRFIFHSRETKGQQYVTFRDSDSRHGMVLVASGMYEGIDLPEDLGRWQVIAKIPWTSLGNPAIRHLADLDPEWYTWETLKTVIQACGRICRTPTDYGVTYILDSSFWRLARDGYHLFPNWFSDALQLSPEQEQQWKDLSHA